MEREDKQQLLEDFWDFLMDEGLLDDYDTDGLIDNFLEDLEPSYSDFETD